MEIRAPQGDNELAHLVETRNAVFHDDPITVEEFVSWGTQTLAQHDLAALIGGTIIGGGRAFLEPSRPNPWVHIWVVPERRRGGVGSALFQEASRWGAGLGHTSFEVWVAEADAEGLAFAERRGFEESGRERALSLDLSAIEAPVVEPPAGITLVTWAARPELARGLYEVAAEAVQDIPGEAAAEAEPFEDWLVHELQGSGDKPEATFVALAGAEVVGYAKFSLTEAQPTVAHHDLTAVKRAWRGRGIAGALKAMQIRWAKENGYTELRTRNEDRNAAIRGLNQRFGYRERPGRIYLRGPIAGS